ncbi:uncharacterized protein stmnd1 [Nelusetta ayraudi]|uniref:uncharacterized protein stmnd1 n=1 Tax=Nelusetta ayraudi TaxID=303726 RepID=UPI003F6E6D3E
MGCSSSTSTAVMPLRTDEANRGEEESGTKPDGRGDSAVSKGTADSGVVMEGGQVPSLPGQVPRQLPVADNVVRPKSSEILEELLNQGIIPVGQKSGAAGEAYSIVLDDGDGAGRRRPPPRLESLKAARTRRVPSKEECQEKLRLAERRRKVKEDELVTRLRVRSARVRVPTRAFGSEVDEDAPVGVTPVQRIQLFSQATRGEAEGEEEEEEEEEDEEQGAGEGGGTFRRDAAGPEDGGRGKRSEDSEEEEEGEEQEETQVEELENDSSFQRVDDREEIF